MLGNPDEKDIFNSSLDNEIHDLLKKRLLGHHLRSLESVLSNPLHPQDWSKVPSSYRTY
jgi:hypothetical protein